MIGEGVVFVVVVVVVVKRVGVSRGEACLTSICLLTDEVFLVFLVEDLTHGVASGCGCCGGGGGRGGGCFECGESV